jgi:hypothetical protein
VAQDLLAKRTQHFYAQLPALFSNKSRAKVTDRMEQATASSAPPATGTEAGQQIFSRDEGEA